jgi:hypothetical protein
MKDCPASSALTALRKMLGAPKPATTNSVHGTRFVVLTESHRITTIQSCLSNVIYVLRRAGQSCYQLIDRQFPNPLTPAEHIDDRIRRLKALITKYEKEAISSTPTP